MEYSLRPGRTLLGCESPVITNMVRNWTPLDGVPPDDAVRDFLVRHGRGNDWQLLAAYIGSSANPGFCDFAVVADMVRGRRAPAGVSFESFDMNLVSDLIPDGRLAALIEAGARLPFIATVPKAEAQRRS